MMLADFLERNERGRQETRELIASDERFVAWVRERPHQTRLASKPTLSTTSSPTIVNLFNLRILEGFPRFVLLRVGMYVQNSSLVHVC